MTVTVTLRERGSNAFLELRSLFIRRCTCKKAHLCLAPSEHICVRGCVVRGGAALCGGARNKKLRGWN